MNAKTTLIYIASDARSGSTLIDYLLSNHNQVESVGELSLLNDYINKRGLASARHNWVCSCRRTLETCQLWSSVLKRYESVEKVPLSRVETSALRNYQRPCSVSTQMAQSGG